MKDFRYWACGIVAAAVMLLVAAFHSLVSDGVLLQGLGTVALSVGLTLKRGATLDSATPDDIVFEDVSDILTWRRPQDSPLYVLMRNVMESEPAQATTVNWQEESTIPRNTTKNGSSASGQSVTIDVNDDIYQQDDILLLPENSNEPYARLHVTSVSSGSVTVERVDDDSDTWGTVPAMDDGEKIIRIGNSKDEFYERSDSRSTYPQEYENHVQRMDEVVSISRTKQATADEAGDSWQRQRDNQVWDFQTSREATLFFGPKEKKSETEGEFGYIGGIKTFGPGNSLSYSASSFSTSKLLDMVRRTFVGDTGSDVRYLHADSLFLQDIMELDHDLKQRDYESQQLRRILPEIDMHFGNLRLIHEQLFDEMGLSRYGFILDYSNIRKRPLNEMKVKRLELEEQDGLGVQLKGEWTVEWRYLDTHAEISGTA